MWHEHGLNSAQDFVNMEIDAHASMTFVPWRAFVFAVLKALKRQLGVIIG